MRKWVTLAVLLGSSMPLSVSAFAAEITGSQAPGKTLAIGYGVALFDLCSRDGIQALGLPESHWDEKSPESKGEVTPENLTQLHRDAEAYEFAKATNHHGSGLADMRAAIGRIDAATQQIFGADSLLATLSGECKVPLAGANKWGFNWNDNPAASAFPEKRLDLARSILTIRLAHLSPDDSLVLDARFLLSDVAPLDEARQQLDILTQQLAVIPEDVLAGVANPAPQMVVIRRLVGRHFIQGADRLPYLLRYHRLARAQAIHSGEAPQEWSLNAAEVNDYVPSTEGEVQNAKLTVDAMETVYGPTDAELAYPLYKLGQRYRSAGRRDDARAALTRALTLADQHSVLPKWSWSGSEPALKAYIEEELAMADQQDGRYTEADQHFTACLRFAKAANGLVDATSCTLNLSIAIDREVEKREWSAADRDFARARALIDGELGPDATEWVSFGQAWAESYKARGNRAKAALQMREVERRQNAKSASTSAHQPDASGPNQRYAKKFSTSTL